MGREAKTLQDEKWMALACAVAKKDPGEVPVGALVVKDGKLIAAAHNRRESNAPFAHAEMLAMDRAARRLDTRRLKGCTLYVTLAPCPMCAGAMIMAQLERCVFGAFDRRQGCCGSVYHLPEDPAFYHRVACRGGVLETRCAGLLHDFFTIKR